MSPGSGGQWVLCLWFPLDCNQWRRKNSNGYYPLGTARGNRPGSLVTLSLSSQLQSERQILIEHACKGQL